MRKKPHIFNVETVAKSRLFHIEKFDVRFMNGTIQNYERLKSSSRGAVLVVPMFDAETALLIREYAAGVHRYELALPKGRIEGDESPEEAANRELMEEVGYGANRLRHITSFTLAPGYFSHVTHVILAQELYPQRRQGDEPEEIEVVPWRLSDLNELIKCTDCTEARSIAALYLVRDLLNDEQQREQA
jgi:ADP-ribose diphosphatase